MPSNWVDLRLPQPLPEAIGVPPPESGYREADIEGEMCGNCMHRVGDECQLWGAIVENDYVCNSWMPDTDLIQESLADGDFGLSDVHPLAYLHCADGPVQEDENGLIWKELAREGELAMWPGANQKPIEKPLRIKLRADDPKGEVSLEDIYESFYDGAVDHVTVPLSHSDRVDENTGFIEELRIEDVPGEPGRRRLMAGHRFTEPDIKEKVKRGSIANTSIGVVFNYVRKRDGKKFTQVLAHNALTNKPWFSGLTPFGVDASDVLQFGESSLFMTSPGEEGPLPGGTKKKDNWVDAVGGLPKYIRRVARDLMEKGMPKARAIAVAISQIKKWAVTSKDPKVKAKAAAAIAEWESKKARAHAKSLKASTDEAFVEMILDDPTMLNIEMSDLSLDQARQVRLELGLRPRPPHARGGRYLRGLAKVPAGMPDSFYKQEKPYGPKSKKIMKAYHERSHPDQAMPDEVLPHYGRPGDPPVPPPDPDYEYNVSVVNAYSSKFPKDKGVDLGYELVHRKKGTRKWVTIGATQDHKTASEWAGRSGYTIRKMRLSDERGEVNSMDTNEMDIDEQTAIQLAEAREENRRLRRQLREGEVEQTIDGYKQKWGDHPVLLTKLREMMLSDDGGAVLMLSEDGKDKVFTVSDVIETIMTSLPAPDLRLSEQHHEDEAGRQPKLDASDEIDQRPIADRAKELAEEIGDTTYLKTISK